MGLAAALLVFTGIWHLTEWMMDERNQDTLRLIPFGVIYLALGILIALDLFVGVIAIVTIIAVLTGATLAFFNRTNMAVRGWVLWAFIVIDVVIVLSIIRHWF